MEQQAADSVTTTIRIPSAPAVPSHAITPSSSNHFQDSVDHGDTIVIVCALAAPKNTAGPFSAKRKRRTFWTACASCNKKSKHSIEHLDCNISCPQCNTTFKAIEVLRPRNQPTTTAENVHSRAIVTSPGTMVEPRKLKPTVETPLPKRVKRDINATQVAGKHGGNLKGINAITKDEINRLLKSKGWNMVIEARINGNNVVQ